MPCSSNVRVSKFHHNWLFAYWSKLIRSTILVWWVSVAPTGSQNHGAFSGCIVKKEQGRNLEQTMKCFSRTNIEQTMDMVIWWTKIAHTHNGYSEQTLNKHINVCFLRCVHQISPFSSVLLSILAKLRCWKVCWGLLRGWTECLLDRFLETTELRVRERCQDVDVGCGVGSWPRHFMEPCHRLESQLGMIASSI